MRPLSYWQREPEMREYAIELDGKGMRRRQVIEALAAKFGEDVAPHDENMITRLRMDVAKGLYTDGGKGFGRRKAVAEALKTTSPRHNPYPMHWRFWDAHPSIRKLAIRMMLDENAVIQEAIRARFGDNNVPTAEQITLLRNRLTTRSQWMGGRRGSAETAPATAKTLSAKAESLFSNEQATECQIPGIKLLTRLQCLKRQYNFRINREPFPWNGDRSAAGTSRLVIPELMSCVKCDNWLTQQEVRLIQRLYARGRIALEARK